MSSRSILLVTIIALDATVVSTYAVALALTTQPNAFPVVRFCGSMPVTSISPTVTVSSALSPCSHYGLRLHPWQARQTPRHQYDA